MFVYGFFILMILVSSLSASLEVKNMEWYENPYFHIIGLLINIGEFFNKVNLILGVLISTNMYSVRAIGNPSLGLTEKEKKSITLSIYIKDYIATYPK